MIKVEFTPPHTDQWNKWISDGRSKASEHTHDFENGAEFSISGTLYKRLKQSHYFKDDIPFYGKCVYCEQKIISNQHGDIEHFRPKGMVTDENDVEVSRVKDGTVEKHPGYFWLAYEWTNLLLSCELCNQPSIGGLGKRNRFPVSGDYCFSPDEPIDDALLINPLIEDPADHIEFIKDTGMLRGTTPKGKMTIEVIGLNLRGLPGERLEFYNDTYAKLVREFSKDLEDLQNTFHTSIGEITAGTKRYSFVSRFAWQVLFSKVGDYLNEAQS